MTRPSPPFCSNQLLGSIWIAFSRRSDLDWDKDWVVHQCDTHYKTQTKARDLNVAVTNLSAKVSFLIDVKRTSNTTGNICLFCALEHRFFVVILVGFQISLVGSQRVCTSSNMCVRGLSVSSKPAFKSLLCSLVNGE